MHTIFLNTRSFTIYFTCIKNKFSFLRWMKDARLKKWKRKKKYIYYNSYNLIYVHSLIIFKISFSFFFFISLFHHKNSTKLSQLYNKLTFIVNQWFIPFKFKNLPQSKKKDKWKRNKKNSHYSFVIPANFDRYIQLYSKNPLGKR